MCVFKCKLLLNKQREKRAAFLKILKSKYKIISNFTIHEIKIQKVFNISRFLNKNYTQEDRVCFSTICLTKNQAHIGIWHSETGSCERGKGRSFWAGTKFTLLTSLYIYKDTYRVNRKFVKALKINKKVRNYDKKVRFAQKILFFNQQKKFLLKKSPVELVIMREIQQNYEN